MRIELQTHSINKVISTSPLESQTVKIENTFNQQSSNQTNEQEIQKENLQQAVNTINEFFEINHSELKFVYHDGLEEYFVQLVNTDTEEVVREIPSKKLLDVFYEMQKLVGMMIDKKI